MYLLMFIIVCYVSSIFAEITICWQMCLLIQNYHEGVMELCSCAYYSEEEEKPKYWRCKSMCKIDIGMLAKEYPRLSYFSKLFDMAYPFFPSPNKLKTYNREPLASLNFVLVLKCFLSFHTIFTSDM